MLTGRMIFLQNPGILQKHTSPKEYHTFLWEGEVGGAGATTQWSTSQLNNRHHENLTPENGVTQFTEQLQHTKPPPLRRCGSVFTGTTRQSGQQVGSREGKTGHQVTHSQHEHRKQRRHSISAPLWGARAGVFLKHTEAFFIRSLRSSL